MEGLLLEYKKRKSAIKKRLKEFAKIYHMTDSDIFAELAFCIFTPQSKALSCDTAVKNLKSKGLLFNADAQKISRNISGVRFHNNKAVYLVNARNILTNSKGINIKFRIDKKDIFSTREWFVKNIKGIGHKEASHFLRNIGLGKDLAILDVHILCNLVKYKVVKELPKTISRKAYIDIENKMRMFSKEIHIPIDELDLLFWAKQTGYIFK